MTSRKDVEQIKTVTIKQSDLRSLITQSGTYDIRYRIVAEDGIPVSNWTPTISIVAPTITQTDANLKVASLGDNDFSLSFVKKYEFPAYDVFVYFVPVINFAAGQVFTNSIKSRPSNTTATYYTPVPHFLKVGMTVNVADSGSNYNITNATITVANATSFTMSSASFTATILTNTTTTQGTIVVSSATGATFNNSDLFFFDRFYDAPGSTTFFTNFNIKEVYAVRTTANVITDMIFDPKGAAANVLNSANLTAGGSIVKYTISNVAANNFMYVALQPGTVASRESKKPEIITSPNMILGKKGTL